MALPGGTAKTKTVLINGMELDGTSVKILTLQNFDPQNIDLQIFPIKGGPPHCPANWTSINTECYKILIGDLNWFEAKAQCEGMDSHLVDFESKEEHEAVLEEALKMEGIGGNNVGLWIGMTDSAEEGTWVWTSGKPVTYTAWSSGEPNNDGGGEAENCAWMYAYQPSGGRLPGQWNDGRCHSGGADSGAICKRAAVAQL